MRIWDYENLPDSETLGLNFLLASKKQTLVTSAMIITIRLFVMFM